MEKTDFEGKNRGECGGQVHVNIAGSLHTYIHACIFPHSYFFLVCLEVSHNHAVAIVAGTGHFVRVLRRKGTNREGIIR